MPGYKLTIAYDGADFCGWQKQEPVAPGSPESASAAVRAGMELGLTAGRPGRVALRTVQAVLERAVREVVREPVLVRGASRTDAGVHARGQVAVFTCGEGTGGRHGGTEARGHEGEGAVRAEDEAAGRGEPGRGGGGWPVSRGVETLVRAVNARLPDDALVVGAEVVPEGFDPISDCTGKGYSYTLHVSPRRPLWDRRYVQHVWVPLDAGAMRAAAASFVGEHDFAAFAAAGHGRVSTVRTVFSCDVVEVGDPGGEAGVSVGGGGGMGSERAVAAGGVPEWARRIRIDVSGDGFLYNMVRIMAGTLVEVGRGKMRPGDVAGAIAGRDRRRAGPTLPATGLCLEWVRYG